MQPAAPARWRPVVLPLDQKGRVECSLQSNSEPRQPNSGHSSPTHHHVRRTKRVSSAISSRSTRPLPKTKNGWRAISIRRLNAERIGTAVLPLPRKNSKFCSVWARPCSCGGIPSLPSSNASSSTAPALSAICSKRLRCGDRSPASFTIIRMIGRHRHRRNRFVSRRSAISLQALVQSHDLVRNGCNFSGSCCWREATARCTIETHESNIKTEQEILVSARGGRRATLDHGVLDRQGSARAIRVMG